MTLDFFPADICIGDTLHREARIVEHEGRAHVFISVDGKPEKIYEGDLVGPIPDGARQIHELATVDGVFTVDRNPTCGCSNVLKRMNKALLMDLIDPAAVHTSSRGQ